MILNLAEIWVVLAVAFAVGCLAGALLHRQLATTRLAGFQDAIAADIAGAFGGVSAAVDGAVQQLRQALTARRRAPSAEEEAGTPPPAAAAAGPLSEPEALPVIVEPEEDEEEPDAPAVREPTPEEVLAGRPPALVAPRDGAGDDLRRIRGIGESYEARLHGLGIFYFDQIAAWSLKQAAWVAIETGAGDRVVRYDWVGQARALAGIGGGPPDEE